MNTGGEMLTFNLNKKWFDKIKSGEKTHEYREVKPYWSRRIDNFLKQYQYLDEDDEYSAIIFDDLHCEFVCGYAAKNDRTKHLKAKILSITIKNGLDTDLKIDTDVFDIEFELIKGGIYE